MKVAASKYCNRCNARVATRCLLWYTVKDYVTIQGNAVPGYANMEDATTRVDLHYCGDCWDKIVHSINEVILND